MALSDAKQDFLSKLGKPVLEDGYGLNQEKIEETISVELDGKKVELPQGAVVLAAITSCTNTSDPYVMIAAGLLARNALARGMRLPVYVKASLSPGSRVVSDYLARAGLLEKLETLGFTLAGYGCMTCIGNSGPFDPAISQALDESKLVAAAVLSGNRNFEGRVQPLVRANYLASPPLVVAYALAGRMDIDLTHDPLGMDKMGKPVTLDQLWPDEAEIHALTAEFVNEEAFHRNRLAGQTGSREWQALKGKAGLVYDWDPSSDYLKEPPFAALPDVDWNAGIQNARALAVFGDGITTDHISPAGAIQPTSPAGRYLQSRGVQPADFNSYGSRRGNDEVMARGTLANIRLKNLLVAGVEGGKTLHLPDGEQMDIFDAAITLPQGRSATGHSRREGVRNRLLPRLGGQGCAAAGGAGGHSRVVRAYSPRQPGGYGGTAAAIPGRAGGSIPWLDRQGEIFDPCNFDHGARWKDQRLRGEG